MSLETNDPAESADQVERAKRSRQNVLQELIETEETYIRDMACVFDGYLDTINNPDPKIDKLARPESFCEDRKKLMFKHIKPIYEFHRELVFVFLILRCDLKSEKMELEILLRVIEDIQTNIFQKKNKNQPKRVKTG